MLKRSLFHLAIPASWLCPNVMAETMAADDSAAQPIAAEIWHKKLEIYVNMCSEDADVFDFGLICGVINRNKGIKAKALIKLCNLVEQLLKISPCGKVVKAELAAAVAHTLEAKKHRQIIPSKSRQDACRYIVSQAFPRWVFWNVDYQIVRLNNMNFKN